MSYRSREDGRYPISLAEVRRMVNIAFGGEPTQDVLDAAEVDEVEAVEAPMPDAGQIVHEGEPAQVGGVWRQTWIFEDAPSLVITPEAVNDEASRRIAAGFQFRGKLYDYDDKAQKRITGAATLAGFAAGAGAPEGYLLWHGGEEPFAWIAMDNSLTQMDAPTCFAFGQAAAAWESAHVFAGRALKDTDGGIPADYADHAHWPPAG